MAIEIVDLPSHKMVVFHSYVKIYQRVYVILVHPRCIYHGLTEEIP